MRGTRAQAAEQRAEAAERAAREASQGAAAAVAATARQNEEAEVEQAAKTLLMAKRTAEATVNEARGQAQALLEDSQNRAQRQLNEANAEATELIRRANEQAEAEFADRRAAVLEEVRGLEGRRAQLADVITQLESRLAGYREELGRTAQEIIALAEDPARLGARPNMSMAPDEVLSSDPEPSATRCGRPVVEPAGGPGRPAGGRPDRGRGARRRPAEPSRGPASHVRASSADPPPRCVTEAPPVEDQDAHYVDLTTQAPAAGDAGTEDQWGPGSWSQVEADLIEDDEVVDDPDGHIDRPTEAVGRADVPRDRFMEELDSAVNEAVPVDGRRGRSDDGVLRGNQRHPNPPLRLASLTSAASRAARVRRAERPCALTDAMWRRG